MTTVDDTCFVPSEPGDIQAECVTLWAVGLGVRRGNQTCQNLTGEH